ncbi:MAG: hypothetical protein EAZ57_08170 [Cytophagales bacterium]|nr:MAG: hypothetical protein EAZ67_09245 [Cytophagales bacterium]TAF60308.1 MAG: hypothetical protein EAZ57_08170 [Cytophagales bacterium]
MFKCFFIVLATLLCVFNARAQYFRNFNTDNTPLPEKRVTCIAVDASDNVWVGTENYLACYKSDSTWRIFKQPNSMDSIVRNISAIDFDAQGNAWVGSYYKGYSLICISPSGKVLEQFRFPVFKNKNLYIKDIAIDAEGRKWIATADAGLYQLDAKGDWSAFDMSTTDNGLGSNQITSVAVDLEGMVWVGTKEGLFSTKDGTKWYMYDVYTEVIKVLTRGTPSSCTSYLDEKGRLQFSCFYKFKDLTRLAKKGMKRATQFNDAAIYKGKAIWIAGSYIAGFEEKEASVKEPEWVYYDKNNSDFKSSEATCVDVNSKGIVWIGTVEMGFYSLDPKIIVKSSVPDSNIEEVNETAAVVATLEEPKKEPTVTINETEVAKGESVSLENLLFENKSYKLLDTLGVYSLFRFMKANPKVKIELAGHTDKDPDPSSPDYERISKLQLQLSGDRVREVVNFLVKRGIDKSRIVIRAFGGTRPIDPNNPEKNRRVEMKILEL